LANFPEIEVFVMVADPQGLILDSKEYLSPIITPHEAYLAFTDQPLELESYRLDYGALLERHKGRSGEKAKEVRGSTSGNVVHGVADYGGNVRDEGSEDEGEGGGLSGGLTVGMSALALGGPGGGQVQKGLGRAVVAKTAAEYLVKNRTFQGVETPATGAEIKAAGRAVQGRAGRAAGYVDEPGQQGV
jgi:diphthamide biosynthesis protein 2